MTRDGRRGTLAGIVAGVIVAGAAADPTLSAAIAKENATPIDRIESIRAAYLAAVGAPAPPESPSGDAQVAQYWPNFPNWVNWNNWANGWMNY